MWRASALRIILVSGFVLEALVAIHSSLDAIAVGAFHVLWIVGVFYALLAVGLYYSQRNLYLSASILIVTVYAAAFSIICFVRQFEVAKLGYLFIYTTPIIARLFFGTRLALVLMLFNTLPFFVLLRNQPLVMMPALDITLPAAHSYIQSLLFLFFNVCLPLAVFRALHALDASALRHRQTSAELETSHAQYQEIFQNAGSPILLCDSDSRILQANSLANALLGRSEDQCADGSSLFDWIALDGSIRFKQHVMDDVSNLPTTAYRTRDGKMVALENISATSKEHYIVALRDVSGLHSMHDALQRSQERESFLSSHDRLTNLPNRDMLRHHLGDILSSADDSHPIALVSFRVNSIRHANEKFGAYAGDVMIRRFAEDLTLTLPPDCFCARLRSIVFSFVIDQVRNPSEIARKVEKIRDSLSKEMDIDGARLMVQLSAGIALARKGDLEPDDLIRRSEVALDSARRSSDHGIALFDESDALQIRRSVEVEVGIVSALKRREFRLVYQPKVTHDGSIAGLEALIRWQSPTLGAVTPGEFIQVAESAGLIREITNFVVDAACAQIRSWLDQYGTCPPVAINLSAVDIARHDLLHLIESCCALHGITPEYLEFEITETGLIGNEALAIHHLDELKIRGFGIAIDDFGTGYSSLSKLSHFPARSIKIDRSFVAQIGFNKKSELIIKAIVSLARILSCTTVAEGVENSSQESFLKGIGCEFFQGFLYYRPMEVIDIDGVLLT
ncbi:MAG: sensor domain-containing phosphodiesterase [Pseudomonadota bacterium]